MGQGRGYPAWPGEMARVRAKAVHGACEEDVTMRLWGQRGSWIPIPLLIIRIEVKSVR